MNLVSNTKLLEQYLSKKLSDSEVKQLERRLCLEPKLARQLVELASDESVLREWGEMHDLWNCSLLTQAQKQSPEKLKSSKANTIYFLGLFLSFMVVILWSGAFLLWGRTNIDVQIVDFRNAEWELKNSTHVKIKQGERLVRDKTYLLSQGVVQLRFSTGSQTLIEGPATFRITGNNKIYLKQGILLAEVRTEEAKGFTVETPTSKNIDHGTVFGVIVNHGGESIMQVFQGKVSSHNTRSGVFHKAGQASLLTIHDRIFHKRDGTSSRHVEDFSQQFCAIFGNPSLNFSSDTGAVDVSFPRKNSDSNSIPNPVADHSNPGAANSKGSLMLSRIKDLVGVTSIPSPAKARKAKREMINLVAAEKLEDRTLLSGGTIVPDDFHNTFDDVLAIDESGPVDQVGIDASSFKDGGVEIKAGDRLSFDTEGNLNALKGRISFKFKPNWDGATDNTTRYFLNSGPFRIFKYHSSSGKDYLVFRFDDGIDGGNGTQREVTSSALEPNVVESWQANTWHTIEAEWDLTLPSGQQYMRLFVDGVHMKTKTGIWDQVQALGSTFTVGTSNGFGAAADGVFDELRIYNEPKLSFYSSFNGSAAVAAEDGTSSGVTFEDAAVNDGVRITSGDQLSFDTAGNIDKNKGKISFKFKPNWDGATDNQTRYFLNAGPFRIFKYHGSTKDYFVFRFDDAAGNQREVTTSSLEPSVVESWGANTWHDIEVEWDLTQPAGQQYLKFTIDGVHTNTSGATTWNGVQDLDSTFTIGTTSSFGANADGVFDELRIYSDPGIEDAPLLSFHAPLESLTSVTNSGGTHSGITASGGAIGNGILVDGSDQLSFDTAGILNKEQGTISFKFKPNWDGDNDPVTRYLFSSDAFRVFKYHGASKDYFVFRFDDAAGNQREVTTSADEPAGVESWVAGEWHTIDLFWDLTGAKGHLGFSIDGVISRASSSVWNGIQDLASTFAVGSTVGFGSQADGVFDELKIYNKSLWNFEDPIGSYINLTNNNGEWDNHETIHNSADAPILSSSILPAEDYLFYEKETFERVYEGTVPEETEIKSTINYTVAQDEFETLFFNLYTRQELNDVTVSFSDFTDGNNTLDDAEIKVVKNWWQAGVTQHKSVFPQYIPEFLLSDDVSGDAGKLDSLDEIRTEAWDAFNLPSFANLPEVHTSLESFTSKQFAIIVNAPEGTPAGTYTSTVTLKDSAGNPLETLTVTLEVLPFQLQDSGKDYLIYHQALLPSESTTSSDSVSLARYEKQIDDIARHGLNGLLVYGSSSTANTAGAQTTKLNYIKSQGIDGKVGFIGYSQALKDLLVANGYEAWFYGVDEPNSDQLRNLNNIDENGDGNFDDDISKIVSHINKSDDIHDIGGKVFTAIKKEWSDKLDDINNPIYSLPFLDTVDLQDGTGTIQVEPLDYANLSLNGSKDYIADLISGVQTSNKESSYYWQSLQELAATNRSRVGFFLWNTGLNGVFPYVYQAVRGNPYDDFDLWSTKTESYRDHLTTYPSEEGPVATIQFEAYREGIDDVRYMQTWTHYYDQLLELDSVAAGNSKATIDAMLNSYKDLATIDSITPATFAADRATLQTEITSLTIAIGNAQSFYSSLDNSAAITNAGGTHNSNVSFQNGGALINSGDQLSFNTAGNLNKMKGRISFKFKPNWDGATDNQTRYFLNAGPFRIFKYHGSTKDYFVFRFDDAAGNQREVTTSSLEPSVVESWGANTWHDIEVEWDLTQPAGQQYLKFTIDGVHTNTSGATTWNGVQDLDSTFTIGTTSSFGANADGVFDELRIYAEPQMTFYSSLNDTAAIAKENGTSSGVTYETAVINNGVHINGSDQLSFNTAGNLDKNKGTIEFKFKPDWDGATDNTTRYFFSAGPFRIFKYHGSTKDYLVFRFDDEDGHQREVTSSGLEPNFVESWQAGTWHDFKAEWDLTLSSGQQFIKLTVDGTVIGTKTNTWHGVQDLASTFTIGANNSFGNNANGVFDELRIYSDPGASSLHAVGSEITNSNVLILNNQQLNRAIQESTRRWQLAGADVSGLRDLTISIGNLGGNLLGQATGNSIVIDGNAAGYGWYVDRNMRTDAEFQRYRKPAGMDLLTVVMHEFGHVLGYDHDDPNDGIATLMDHTLDVGERHSPDGFQSDENIVKDTRKGWWKRFRKSKAGV